MKNLYKYFMSMAVVVVALSACQKEVEQKDAPAKEKGALQICVKANVDGVKNDAGTKTYIDGTSIKWGTGEYMKIGVYDGSNTKFGNSSDDSADIWNGEAEAMFNFTITPATEAEEYTYYGLYPASSAVASSNTNPASYKVNLTASQNATAASYDPKAYILVAKPEGGKTAASADWEASFRRATALNKITLKNLPEAIKRVAITAPETVYLAGSRHIDLTNGESGDIYDGGGKTNKVTVKFDSAQPSGSDVIVWFTSWDATIEVDSKLTIVAYSEAHTFTRELTVVNKPITFKEGCLNTLNVDMATADQGDNTEFAAGTYVVLAKDGSNYYALKAEKEEGKERLLSVAYDGALDSYSGDADIIWNISESGDSFIFENSGKYLGYKGSNNESYWLEAGESWTETNYLLDITAQETAGLYHVTLKSNASRYLSKNTSSAFFAFYGNTGQKADIVFVPATVDTRSDVTLAFEDAVVNLTTSDYDQFFGQEEVTVTPDEDAIKNHLEWSYEDTDSIIDEFDNGALVLNGNTGTATVTVSFAGDENYRPAEASYTINVTDGGSATGWFLVEDAESVDEGDYIITWENSYYLPSGSTSGTNPAVGSGITVSGNTVTNTVTDDMVWTFTGDNTNGFTISDGTNILHSTNAAQGISINTSSTRKWTVSVNATYGMLLHGDDGGTRYLAVYNSASWRYYSIGNSYTGKLRLYKHVTAPDTRQEAGMSWNAEAATATFNTGNTISFTAPTLDQGNASAVTYESTDDTIATIDENTGEVTIAALNENVVTEGSTTIKAVFAGDDNYKPQTVSYTLTVADGRDAVPTPTFNPAAGEIDAGTVVSFECSEDNVNFHYTVNGTTPTVDSPTGSSVTINEATTVKVLADKLGFKPSEVASASYTISGAVVTYDFETIATLNSLVTSESSSYNGYLTDAVVSFVPATGTAFIKDATGTVMIYKSNHGLQQGQTYTGEIEVTAIKYNGLYSEITEWDATFTGETSVVDPESIDLSSLIGHYDDYQNAYVQVAGLTVESISGKNINVTDGSNSYVVYDNPGSATCTVGDVITAIGTITKFGETQEIKVWKASDIIITAFSPKAITFSQPSGAAGEAGCAIAVSVGGENITSGTTVAAGTTVTLTATVGTDYEFNSWSVAGATVQDASSTSTTFIMGTSAVSVNASFTSTGGGSTPVTVSMDSFDTVSGLVGSDENVSYAAEKGSSATAPGVYSGVIRIYQNGGLLTITANNGKNITNVTIGSSMATTVQVNIDGGGFSSNNSISANGTYSTGTISASSTVVFKCTGTTKNARLYLNYLSVTYE